MFQVKSTFNHPLNNDPFSGDFFSGNFFSGNFFSSVPFSGDPFSGDFFSSVPFSGDPFSGNFFSSVPFSGDPFSGNFFSSVQLAIMSRAPQPGKVKTRLIKTLGATGACQLQMACLNDIFSEAVRWCAEPRSRQLHFFYTPADSLPEFKHWQVPIPPSCTLHPQRGDTLTERMAQALTQLRASPTNPVLLVGSDIPLLSCQHWDQALLALQSHQLVFGPALDGGYYLLGTRIPDNSWLTPATEQALKANLAVAAKRHLTYDLIPALSDLDVEADLWQLLKDPNLPQASQRQAVRWLKRWLKR